MIFDSLIKGLLLRTHGRNAYKWQSCIEICWNFSFFLLFRGGSSTFTVCTDYIETQSLQMHKQWSWHLIKSKIIILVSSLRSTIINLAREESYDILLKKISTPTENIRVGRQDASPIFLHCFCLKIRCCNVTG